MPTNGKISVKAGLTLNESTWGFPRIECRVRRCPGLNLGNKSGEKGNKRLFRMIRGKLEV